MLTLILIVLAVAQHSERPPASKPVMLASPRSDGLAAWQKVYSVMVSPRCLNCHTATNYPQQGDDRHRHVANVIRGPQDKGVVALNCSTCHQSTNADSTGAPGAHNWHLAPLSMRWQDANDRPLSSGDVCRSVLRRHAQRTPSRRRHDLGADLDRSG
jgi:mono/diheme cytochrome c family protein